MHIFLSPALWRGAPCLLLLIYIPHQQPAAPKSAGRSAVSAGGARTHALLAATRYFTTCSAERSLAMRRAATLLCLSALDLLLHMPSPAVGFLGLGGRISLLRSGGSVLRTACSARGAARLHSSSTPQGGGVHEDPDSLAVFYGESVPFESLGLAEPLCKALSGIGMQCSTSVQAKAIPRIMAGEDVVLGAETGSGKTLAYLLPIMDDVIKRKLDNPPDELLGNARSWAMFPHVVVLAPNRELCEQVVTVATALTDQLNESDPAVDQSQDSDFLGDSSRSAFRVEALYGGNVDYPYSPYKTAPDVLVCTPQFLSGFGGLKNIPLFVRARTLVMDEADMLLDGHYKRQVEDILMGFRRADKLQDMGIPRTQYVLAAATLPTQGLKSVRGAVTKLFPDATSVTADHMHRQHPAMSQTWMQVGLDLEDKTRQLVDVLRAEDKRRTMVFANTAASCKRAAAAVRDAGIPFAQYHSDVGHMERAQALDDFRDGTVSVLVCTDLASRGLDIPGVTTVIQMEFATNVVQHLHRLGRTARAGKEGRAITFWDSNGAELAKRIQEAGQDGTLDESFSRRRGLRNSVKKAAAGGRGASRREQYRQR